jgi:hypothetical protein
MNVKDVFNWFVKDFGLVGISSNNKGPSPAHFNPVPLSYH